MPGGGVDDSLMRAAYDCQTGHVLLVVLAVLAGLVLARLRGGSLDHLEALDLRRRRLVVLALLAQAAGAVVGGPLHATGLAVSAGLVAAFLVANRGVRGTGLVALGLAANALVVGLNGAMPVSTSAAARVGLSTLDVEDGLDPRHELVDDRTRLPVLADVIALPLPLRPEVVSAGDVLVAAGLAQLVVVGAGTRATRGGGRRRTAPPPVPATGAPGPRPSRPSRATPSPIPRPSRGRPS